MRRRQKYGYREEQSSQMQLMVYVTERNWIHSWPGTIQTNVERQLNMGNAHWMMAESYMEDNMKD